MTKRLIALLLALCLLFSAAPVHAGAASGQQVCASNVTVTAGNTAYMTLTAENFNNIAALDVYVYYDSAVFTVSGTTNGNMLSGAQTSVNTSELGTIKLSAMALNGINGTGNLLTVRFATRADCTPGTYPVTVAIGRAYDGNLAEASISGVNGSVTVNKPVQTEYFSLSGSRSPSTVKMGDTLTCQINNSGSRSFVSGEFIFTYDHELFAFESVTLATGLTGEGAVHSVNSSVLGQVRIAYASNVAVSSYQLFTVKLTVIGDVNTTSTLKATASNMYRADLSAYLSGSWSQSVTLKKQQLNDFPDAFLRTEQMVAGQQSKSVFCLEAGTGLAAADFTIAYDTTILRCVDVKVCDGVETLGGMVIINENFAEGTIRFSYINMDAYSEAELPIVEITWEPLRSPDSHYQTTLSGVGVVDTDQKAISLDYITDSGCIFIRTVVPPACLLDGYTDFTCACGENFQTDPTEKLGHDIHQFPAQEVTCTEIGWDAYEGCSRCDYGTYVEIPALGHDEIVHEAQVQTCTGIGWAEYVTCSRCDYSTYAELPALGHRVIMDLPTSVDPLTIQNVDAVPFEIVDGKYYSQNHTDSSRSEFTITALYDCSVTLTYGVSSESSYDKLIILKNESQEDAISGTVTEKTLPLSLSAGDVITVCYTKDGSARNGEDRGWVSLNYEYVVQDMPTQVPAEEKDPTCTEAVVCFDCGTVIKAALGHDEVPRDGKAPTCLESGWTEFVTCTRCDYSTYEALSALGHDEIVHEAQVQTCTGIGWAEYVTCSRCDYSTYAELPALGHRVVVSNRELVDPLTIQNDGTVPFEFTDGKYYSQNHAHSSQSEFTITALYDCSVTLTYGVSSESSYDKLIILKNGNQQDLISGTVTGKTLTLSLSAADVITVRYTKDGSVSNGEDRGWVALSYEHVWIGEDVEVPAHTLEPDCTNAVVCTYCQTVIKEALGHDEIPHAAQVETCTGIGWAEYVICSRCDYTTYEEIPALGHDEILHAAQAATCLEIGWDAYETCSRCDFTTYQEIPALGHRVMAPTTEFESPFEVQNTGAIPFLDGEGYDVALYSNNHTNDSVSECTVIVLNDCYVALAYGVSSEENGDYFYVFLNGEQLDAISGEQEKQMQLELNAGDVLTFRYEKNAIGTGGLDIGVFALVCVYVMQAFPAEEFEPTCTEAVTCSFCQLTIKEALGHVEIPHDGKAVTCLESGWDAYVTCSRCDYTSYVEIPALGHDEILHAAQAATCLEIGWDAYVTCSRCDYTTYKEIAALGHRVIGEISAQVVPVQIQNDGTLPFVVLDGIYYSQNHADGSESSFQIVALYDCTVTLNYGVSSEANYDKLIIKHNNTQLNAISGTTTMTRYLDMAAGDVLQISYSKDGSVNQNEDRGWISLDYELVWGTALGDIPAENVEPTCTQAVVCAYCQTEIKEALGHDEIPHDGKAVTCLESGWDAYVTCSRCDYTTYEEIPALGHDEVFHDAQAVTCLEIGWDAYVTCSRCDYTTYEEIAALGHDEITYEAKTETCTDIGWDAYVSCSRCDYTTYEEIAALGHDEIAHAAQAQTCTEIGWNSYVTCSRCDYTTYEEISANGHSFMDKVCLACGVGQAATMQWDVSINGDGSVMAYAYAHMDGTYLLEIIGNGPTRNYSSSPFNYSLSGKIDDIRIAEGITSVGNYLFSNLRIQGAVQIADSVATIGNRAFYGFSGPKTISLPAGVTSIGDFAFYGSKDLIVILQGDTMPSSLGSIWDYNCGHYLQPQQIITTEDATYVIDRNGKAWIAKCYKNEPGFVAETSVNGVPVTGIGAFAFDQKSEMITYIVPAEITEIGTYAFRECNKLTVLLEASAYPTGFGSLNTDGPPSYLAPQKVIQMEDRLYVLDKNGEMYLARYFGSDKTVTVEAEVDGHPVQHIGNYVFANRSVQSVVLPDGIQTIGAYAFIHCTVKQISMPDSLTKIGTWGFFGADITSIVIPENVTTIDSSAFSYCDYLKVIYVKSPVVAENIDSTSDYGNLCKYAQSVVIPATVENTWLSETYAYREEAWTMDMDCVIYSNCAHNWQQTVVSEYVACQTDGVTQFVCGDCTVEKVQITKCHDEIFHDAKAETCTDIGWDAYVTCSRCDYTTYEEIAALGHDEIAHAAQAATCLEIGWDAYETCSRCDYSTYKEIAALGHDEIYHAAQAVSCLKIGWDTYVTCSRCDYTTYEEIPATGHTVSDWIIDREATYEADGNKHKECTVCHVVLETSIIPMLTHSYESVITFPTCTEQGYTTHTCRDCGNSYVDDYVPATGHHYGEWVETKAATCTATGTDRRDCDDCDYFETHDVAELGHDKVSHDAKAATCQEIGWDAYETCSRCDYTTYEELAALGHDAMEHNAQAVTCLEIGWDAYVTCSRCDYTTYEEIAALGHDAMEHNAQAATCLDFGWNAYETCSRCDYTTYEEIAALGHDEIAHAAQAATCQEIGWDAYVSCSRCDYTTYEEVAALGHDAMEHNAQAATCQEIGWNAYETCSRCDYTTYEEIPALGHDAIHHKAQAATCLKIGWNAYDTCSRCDYSTYKEIAALGHDAIEHNAQAATCLDFGWNAYETCSRCDYTTYEEIPALGHDAIHHKAQAATCLEIGWDAYVTCSRCDYTTYEEIPATGHTVGDWIVDREATYEADGSKHKECTVCQVVLETSIIPMLTHSYESVITLPTCTEHGYTTHTCRDCGNSYVDDYVPATGHHYGEWVETKAATCTATGTERRDCDDCDYFETHDVAELGHDKVSHDAKAATCLDFGWNAYETCSRCDYTTYEEIAALGHDEIAHEAQAASCTEIGWDAYETCSRCDYSTYEEIAALGHDYQKGYCVCCDAEDPDYQFMTADLHVGTAIAESGKTVTVPVMISGNPGIARLRLRITYDATALTYVSFQQGDVITRGTMNVDFVDGELIATWSDANNITEDGTLVSITFAVTDTASGKYPVNVACSPRDVVSADLDPIDCTVHNGFVGAVNLSGFVYEGATSNRVSDVKMTLYHIPYDTNDKTFWDAPKTENAQVWDASEWGQAELLHTDASGCYALAVPNGWWQVVYEKENYETVYSEWLPISSSHAQANTGMISTAMPAVDAVETGKDSVVISFSQYIDPASVTGIVLKDTNGNSVEYIVEYSEDETDAIGNVLVKTFTLKLANATVIASVDVPETVTSYAGKQIAAYYKEFDTTAVIPGDVNDDGVVDTIDRMVLNRYLANWEGYTADSLNMAAADVNGDGVVDTIDRMVLSRHLANWTGYETLPYAG